MDTRESLLHACAPIFAELGLEGATVKDIAAAAGVNAALISYHFGGKEGLYKALLQSIGIDRLSAVERILRPAKTHDEFRVLLRLFVEEFLLFHLKNPYCMRIVHRDFDGKHPIALEVFKEVFLKIYYKLQGFFEIAKREGLLREDVDADTSASMLCGGVLHSIQMDFLRQEVLGVSLADPEFARQVVDQFTRTFCDGALTRSQK